MEHKTIIVNGYTIDVHPDGVIYAHSREIVTREDVHKTIKGRFLKMSYHTNGYAFYSFKLNLKTKSERVHRLVATAFIPNPLNLPCVNHKDGNKQNNHVNNLEWCTISDNLFHAYRTGLKKHVTGELHGNATLLEKQVFEILKDNRPQTTIALDYGVTPRAISSIKNGKLWGRITGIKYVKKRKDNSY